MTECYLIPENDDIPCRCNDCDAVTPAGGLDMITDIQERISPGCIVPAGQCPSCGALAYYEDDSAPDWSAQAKGVKMIALLHRNLEAWDNEEDSVKEEHEDLITMTRNFLEGK